MPLLNLTFPDPDTLPGRSEEDLVLLPPLKGQPAPSLRRSDVLPLRNRERYEQAYAGFPHNLDIHIFGERKRSSDMKTLLALNPDAIQVIIQQNESFNRIPLTPWIVLHRMVHAIDVCEGVEYSITKTLLDILIEMIAECYSSVFVQRFIKSGGYECNFLGLKSEAVKVFEAFMTTRCAREGKLNQELDVGPELVAQHIMCSGVKFRHPQLIDVEFWTDGHYVSADKFQPSKIDLSVYERRIDKTIDRFFHGVVGRQFYF